MNIIFDNNQLAASLFGVEDHNLAVLEQALGVTLYNRGNHVIVEGAQNDQKTARYVLNRLYRMLEKGGAIDDDLIDELLLQASLSSKIAESDGLLFDTPRRKIYPRTQNQALYMKAILDYKMVFGLGPAGTGKTWLAVAAAAEALAKNRIERIILTRPAVEAGERLGFLPGALKDKVDPYLRPIYDALDDVMRAEEVAKRIEQGDIEIAPLAYMRGRTLKNAFVILDEAQNTTKMQMKMFLTRMGKNSHMIINGDLSQVDLPAGQPSGLGHAVSLLSNIPQIAICTLDASDVIRHRLVSEIIKAYDHEQH